MSASYQFQLLDLAPPRPPMPLPAEPVSPEREKLRQLRASLAPIGAHLSSGTELIRALAKEQREGSIPTTLAPIDQLLGGGLPRGKMVEIAGRAARFSIAMSLLAAATSMGEAAALIDLGDHFDPQLAEADGVDLRRLLWVRPHTMKEAVTAAEMLAPTGFQLVILEVGLHPIRGRRAPESSWVRLARSAEAHGTVLLVSTPYPLTGTASEAVLVGNRVRPIWSGGPRAPRLLTGVEITVRLEKHRHLRPGRTATLTLTMEEAIANGRPTSVAIASSSNSQPANQSMKREVAVR